jgi:hypothetical protein
MPVRISQPGDTDYYQAKPKRIVSDWSGKPVRIMPGSDWSATPIRVINPEQLP